MTANLDFKSCYYSMFNISQRYKIDTRLLQDINRNWHVAYWIVPSPMTLSGLWRSFRYTINCFVICISKIQHIYRVAHETSQIFCLRKETYSKLRHNCNLLTCHATDVIEHVTEK